MKRGHLSYALRAYVPCAAMHNLFIAHMDARNAFLHRDCNFELYIEQPEGFVDQGWPTAVWRLNKSLYGLKQAPRIWYLLLCETICSLGFEVCVTDPSLYFYRQLGMILAVCVMIFWNSTKQFHMFSIWKIKDRCRHSSA